MTTIPSQHQTPAGDHAPGDVTVTLNDEILRLRLSFSAALAIEDDTKMGLVDLTVNHLRRGRIKALAHTFHRLLEAGGKTITFDDAGTLMTGHITEVLTAVLQCLSWALTGEKPTPDDEQTDPPKPMPEKSDIDEGDTPEKKPESRMS